MEISWTKCSDRMPVEDVNALIICRSNGKRIWDTNGYALNTVFHQNPDWDLKKHFIEWIPYSEEAWKELNK